LPDIIIPPRITPRNNNDYFEILTKAVFQAGFSWKTVEHKWGGFQQVFQQFDPFKVSIWGEEQILEAVESPEIIRNIKKIEATVFNAQQFINIVEEYGDFRTYIDSIREQSYYEKVDLLKKRFKWLGKTGSFFFFWSINEEVPDWHDR